MLANDVAQLCLAQAGGINQLGRTCTDGRELSALTRHALRDARIGCKRMRTAGLLVAANDDIVRCLDKEQLIGDITRIQFT